MESDNDWRPAHSERSQKKATSSASRAMTKGRARGKKKKFSDFDAFDDRDKATPEDLGGRERFEFSPDDTGVGTLPPRRGNSKGRMPIQRAAKGEGGTRPAFRKPDRGEPTSWVGRPGKKSQGGRPKPRKVAGANKDRPQRDQSEDDPVVPLESGPGLPDPRAFEDAEALASMAGATTGEVFEAAPLYERTLNELMAEAGEKGLSVAGAPTRRGLIDRIVGAAAEAGGKIVDEGILYVAREGHGFIVRSRTNYKLQPDDPYIAPALIRRYGLRPCHPMRVQIRLPKAGERCPAVLAVMEVMGRDPEAASRFPHFEELVPAYPDRRIPLEMKRARGGKTNPDVSMRAVEILAPVGFGQRGLIVAPPRTGKTVLLQGIANSVATNSPATKLIVVLVDERPEDVAEYIGAANGEVIGSTFDEPVENHVHAADMAMEKARRLVEAGEDVVMLVDSITRLVRAYNAVTPGGANLLSDGVEAEALQRSKQFFGSARNIEGGGSLTILATALIDTGSDLDEVIFEEFKGAGNMELHLDRSLVDNGIFPAINIEKSGTAKEELLYNPHEMGVIYSLRRSMQGVPIVEAMERFIRRLEKTADNAGFFAE